MNRIPYVIDTITVKLVDVLNELLAGQPQPQFDIATAYFSVRGYEFLRGTLPGVRHLRLLIGDNSQDADAAGLQPNARAYLRNKLNVEPLMAAIQQLVEELIRFLRRDAVKVRRYLGHAPATPGRHTFLHAKCYLVYGGRGDQQTILDYLNPLVGIVGSSNFTAPGLKHNNELNLVHKTLLQPDEVDDQIARSEVAHHTQLQPTVGISPRNQPLLKSEVGARAILTLRRIAEEDDAVIEKQESFLELASSEALLAELQRVLATEAQQWLTELDDEIHSGLQRVKASGIFFYFTAPHPDGGRFHFWRYYDALRRAIIDNRYQIMQLLACGPETPRHPPPYAELDVFDIQEQVIASILKDFVQQQALAIIDKPVAEEQNIVANILREHANNPTLDRNEIRELRKFLKQPLVGVSIQTLHIALKHYSANSSPDALLETLRILQAEQGQVADETPSTPQRITLTRADLHLVCYEYISA